MKVICFNCKTQLDVPEPISRKEECSTCGTDVRCCKNCEFYDPKVYNECKETQADRILEKDRANLCDFFRPRKDGGGSSAEDQKAKQRAAAEALFKNFKKS